MIRHLFPEASFVSPRDFASCVFTHPLINCIGEPTATLVHRSAFDRFGPFNPNFKVLTDWDFFARVAIHHGLCYIDDELATFRVHSKSTTQRELGHSPFHDFDLDKLIMLHELAYSDAFEPAREEARRRRHAIDLRILLAREVQRVRRKAKDFAGSWVGRMVALMPSSPNSSASTQSWRRGRAATSRLPLPSRCVMPGGVCCAEPNG